MKVLVYIPYSMRDYKTKKFRCAEESHMNILLNEASILPDVEFHILCPRESQIETFPKKYSYNVKFISRNYKYIKEERSNPDPVQLDLSKYDVIYTHECYNFEKVFGVDNYHKALGVVMYVVPSKELQQSLIRQISLMKLVFFRTKFIRNQLKLKKDFLSLIFDCGINPKRYDKLEVEQENLVVIPTRISDEKHNRTMKAILFSEENFPSYKKILLNPNNVDFEKEGWMVGPYNKQQYHEILAKAKCIVNFNKIKEFASLGVAENLLLSKAITITYSKEQFENPITKDTFKKGNFKEMKAKQLLFATKFFDLRDRKNLLLKAFEYVEMKNNATK